MIPERPPSSLPSSGSEAVHHARAHVEDIAAKCIDSAWAPATKKTYESGLKVWIGSAETVLAQELLPLDSSQKLMLAFARMDGQSWSLIQRNKAAVRAWHAARGLTSAFDDAWDDLALLFWAGLKRRAKHTSEPKVALTLDQLLEFQTQRMKSGTPAGLRDATMAAFSFFGIRRVSEAISLDIADITISEDCCTVRIRFQKNDPNGKGMECWIPRLPAVGALCPASLIETWCTKWKEKWSDFRWQS